MTKVILSFARLIYFPRTAKEHTANTLLCCITYCTPCAHGTKTIIFLPKFAKYLIATSLSDPKAENLQQPFEICCILFGNRRRKLNQEKSLDILKSI